MEEIISLICPVYNCEQYLPTLINSIINQTFKNFVCYFIDDNSCDKSSCIINSYNDKRIKYFKNDKNIGATLSRKKGLQKANGEFVIFIDGDDYLHTDLLRLLYLEAIKTNADIIMCDYYIVNKNNKIIYQNDKTVSIENKIFPTNVVNNPEVLLSKVPFWNKLIKRTFILQNDFFLDVAIAQDLALLPILFQNAKLIAYINKPLYFYRYQKVSISHNINADIIDIIRVIDHLKKHLKDCYYQEFEYISITHLLFQISKVSLINDKNMKDKIYEILTNYLLDNFHNVKNNKYLKKRAIYLLCYAFFTKKLIFKRLSFLIKLIKNSTLNIKLYKLQ